MSRNYVPTDIIEEINLRLPGKSVGRFRCVSKQWLQITTDPKFLTKFSKSKTCFYLINSSQAEILYVTPFSSSSTSLDGGANILAACNGLIICCSPSNRYLHFVRNPTMGEHFLLPYPPNLWLSYTYNLAFDSCISPHFKIYAMTKHYYQYRERNQHVYRFSSETWTWENIYSGEVLIPEFDRKRSVYWKGNLCWESWISTENNGFLLLNVGTEEFSWISGPMPEKLWIVKSVVESSERLVCVVQSVEDPLFEYNVFGMEDLSSGWSLLYHVELNLVLEMLYPSTRGVPELAFFQCKRELGVYEMEVMSFARLDGEEDILLLHVPTKIVAYNLQRGTFSTVWSDQTPYCNEKLVDLYAKLYVWPHADLLYSLRCIEDVIEQMLVETDHAERGKYVKKATGKPLRKRKGGP